ncbi:DUF2188 domain-containing protein [Novosphingopyxis sp.]|uniref:DUF2188 domain-containing protein n=1 Tax=Novosphingopyxis sp. TaxID=2709690 RepID=UPI003B5A9791
MASKNQHVVHRDGQWAVKSAGSKRASSRHATQKDATRAARAIARNQQTKLLIHGRDGRIRLRDSYGHDPHPPRG